MALKEELKSGKFGVYAQWSAILSILLLIIFGVGKLTFFPWSLLAIVAAVIMMFLEIPFLTKCFRTGPRFEGFLKFFENNLFRSVLYLVFGFLMYLSIVGGVSTILVPAIGLTFTTVFYLLAVFRKEGYSASSVTGGHGVA
ncbi:hypothetical protein BJ742DRAFT_69504 [Cladochytrium replicatum]|nr:hypothetical protein BJ742DRAFT_69504 [Cladochytrium replicatum]